MKTQFVFLVLLMQVACGGDDVIIDPSVNNEAIPVYNQTYQENFQEDKVDDIIANACII